MSTENLRVLLVEDNPGDVRLIKEMLVDAKYTAFSLECAERLRDGLARLHERETDVVLLDLSLPDSSGLDTFVTFYNAAQGVPIVVLSGLNDETTAVECVKAGAQDYLIKGEVDGHLLIRSLRYAVGRGILEQERYQLLERERIARAEAEAANHAKDEFLAVVSHELRTPLNAMLGWSRMLATGKLDSASARRGVESIERNARAQAQLIEDLLDISRITTGKLRLNTRPLELSSLINDTVDAMRPAVQAKEITLQVEINDDVGFVLGDSDRLQQVLWNLFSNAIKFTPAGGRVQVTLERIDSYAQLSVADTGQGIDPEFLPHVFERFRQADSSTTRKFGGLGLGLSIVRSVVEHHGGIVQVASPGEGQGSTFTVLLPLLTSQKQIEESTSEAPSKSADEGVSLAGLRVLVLDDDEASREVTAETLLQFGAEVLTTATVSEALEALDLWDPDLMLTNIEMPNEAGYSLMQRVRTRESKQSGSIPMIAYGKPENRVRALNAGYQICVPKPIAAYELAAAVARLGNNTDALQSSNLPAEQA